MESGAGTGISSGSGADMPVLEVNKKLLEELEAMGFPRARSTRALHYSGNSSLEEAINWVIDHENDLDIDQMPLVTMNIDLEPSQPFHITKQMKMKAQELRDRARKKKEEDEKQDRIRASKDLTEAKQIAEEDERKRHLALQKAEKEEEKRARDKILRKLEQDKVERRFRLGLPPERSAALNPSTALLQEYKTSLPVKFDTKAEPMRECLRTIKRNHQDRVGNLKGGIEFLELCGFEGTEGGNFLCLPREKVDMAALYTAGSELKSAMTNPFFGVLSRK